MNNFKLVGDLSWIVCQIGAREHYSIPRALLRNGQKVLLYTDFWKDPNTLFPVPEKLRQRFHPEIKSGQVISWNNSLLGFEVSVRLSGKKNWEVIQNRNKWFSEKVSRHLKKVVKNMSCPPVVFAFSYAARKIFTVAKSLGCPTVLGQIDPGPVEMELVAQLHRDAGIPFDNQPTDEYWSSWKVECELADQIIVNSQWSFSALKKEGVSSKKMAVVPLAYEPSKLQVGSVLAVEEFSAARPLRVLFLGQVNLRKGALELAQAIEALKGAPVQWTVVGTGEEWLIDKLRNLPQTVVVGGVSRKDVARYYNNADVFILPTHSDGYALTQLEAASYGLPIISSRFCGEVVQHEVNGMLLKEVTATNISDAVRQLIEAPKKLVMYRENMINFEYCTIQDLADNLSMVQGKNEQTWSQRNK